MQTNLIHEGKEKVSSYGIWTFVIAKSTNCCSVCWLFVLRLDKSPYCLIKQRRQEEDSSYDSVEFCGLAHEIVWNACTVLMHGQLKDSRQKKWARKFVFFLFWGSSNSSCTKNLLDKTSVFRSYLYLPRGCCFSGAKRGSKLDCHLTAVTESKVYYNVPLQFWCFYCHISRFELTTLASVLEILSLDECLNNMQKKIFTKSIISPHTQAM